MNLADKLYEGFGLEKPEADGGKGQEVADPADIVDGQGTEGEKGQEVADPADVSGAPEDPAETDVADDEDDAAEDPTGEIKQPLTAEERRANAARRREQEKREHEQAVADAVAEAEKKAQERFDKQMEGFFATAKIKDTFTGEPIKTMEQFNAWQQKFRSEQVSKDLKAGRLTQETLQQMISDNPIVQQAQQMLDAAQKEKNQFEDQRFRAQVESELAEIRKMDPSIQGIEDLLKLPKADQWREKVVKGGHSYLDAYKLVYGEDNARKVAEAAKQAALNNARGKDHLKAAGARGAGNVPVPAGQMRYYRLLNPKMTDAEITADYNRRLKKGGN